MQIPAGPLGDQAIDDRDGRIVRVLHPEQDLHRTGIVLIAKRCQPAVQRRFGAAQWLQDSDARKRNGSTRAFADEPAHRGGREQGISAPTRREGDKDDCQSVRDGVRHDHSASGLSRLTRVH